MFKNCTIPSTIILLPIPIPPATLNAPPLVELIAGFVFEILKPPSITKLPTEQPVLCFVFEKYTILFACNVPLISKL